MIFLGWENEKYAEDSLAAINVAYGCPYVAENGYRMDRWADIKKVKLDNYYGFAMPEARLGQGMDVLMAVLVPGFTEKPYDPEDFFETEEK